MKIWKILTMKDLKMNSRKSENFEIKLIVAGKDMKPKSANYRRSWDLKFR